MNLKILSYFKEEIFGGSPLDPKRQD